ncbi:MAG: cupin [Microcoleus vaginatus WJT46-NPBG5]|nr:cupin [Microcoleus vaginatus WJT46-NPBG5]
MESHDWLVTDSGQCQACVLLSESEWPTTTYRLYRFLTEVEDILLQVQEDRRRLQAIRPLVRRLLTSSYWLQCSYLEPSPETGWSVLKLYEEPNFPLCVQIVSCLPGKVSTIHQHGTWAIVALISGQEKNTFWQRTGEAKFPNRVQRVGEHILQGGDILGFTSNVIHCVEALGDEPTVSFHISGKPENYSFLEFEPVSSLARNS